MKRLENHNGYVKDISEFFFQVISQCPYILGPKLKKTIALCNPALHLGGDTQIQVEINEQAVKKWAIYYGHGYLLFFMENHYVLYVVYIITRTNTFRGADGRGRPIHKSLSLLMKRIECLY